MHSFFGICLQVWYGSTEEPSGLLGQNDFRVGILYNLSLSFLILIMNIISADLLFISLPFISSHLNVLCSSVNEVILRSVTPMTILASVWKFRIINCN
jgi:hypothetical protein